MPHPMKHLLNPDEGTESATDGFAGAWPRRSAFLGPLNPLGDSAVFSESLEDSFSQIHFDTNIDPQMYPMDWYSNEQETFQRDLTPLRDSLDSILPSIEFPLPEIGSSIACYSSPAFPSSQLSVASTTEADANTSIVCYGMLHSVDVKMVGADMAVVKARLQAGESVYQYFSLGEPGEYMMLRYPEDKVDFGYLRSGEGKTISSILTHEGIQLEPKALRGGLLDIVGRASTPKDAMAKVDIDFYGPQSKASLVGGLLSKGKLWLQRPNHTRPGVPYKNPHVLEIKFRVGDVPPPPTTLVPVDNEALRKRTREEKLRRMVEEIYQSMNNNRQLERVDGGHWVNQKLLRHQEEALGFMLERETGQIKEGYRLWQEVPLDDGRVEYKHKITKARRYPRPDESGGGILADEMGTGKSLSILALIGKTLDFGRDWAKHQNIANVAKMPALYSGATLVLAWSALLIENWSKEIQKHLRPGLQVIKYHGSGRVKDVESLGCSDIVITTYHTLNVEYLVDKGRSSVLHQIGWYRVVLDEAHIIRRPSTTFFHSCNGLSANSRWCLTGTPIQNKLADIGTLFSFIHAEPFVKPSVFRKWIEIPLEVEDADENEVKGRLSTLMAALCLRRTKAVLKLPGIQPLVHFLEFTPGEREQYEKTKRTLERTMRSRVGEIEKSSKFSPLQVKLQLRLLCNHGTFQKPFSWWRSHLEEREAIVGAFGFHGEISCSVCEQPMPILGLNYAESKYDQCSHVICDECIDESRIAESETEQRKCPVCAKWSFERTSRTSQRDTGSQRSQESASVAGSAKRASIKDDHENYFNQEGYSKKIDALIQDVSKDLWTMKSIIFSCWTRTLYLVSRHLEKAGIPYLQVDGDCPLSQRQKKLEEFAEEGGKPVLIMTTGTGAFGLNLTCANRIFIVELQWNPSVEYQAIARATRLGQKSEVCVIRYVIKDTVEEDIAKQQQHKKKIAASTLGFGGPEGMEIGEEIRSTMD